MDNWRYIAFSVPGGQYLGEIDLVDVAITRTLSGPGRLTGTVPAGGRVPPGVKPWRATVWAEASGVIRGGGILTPFEGTRGDLRLTTVGISGYPQGQP